MSISFLPRWRGRLAARPRAPVRGGLSWLLMLPFALVALLLGAVAALDSPVLLTLLAGPILVILLFFLVKAEGLLWSLFAMTFLVQGSLLYFLNLRQATWVAIGMAVLFLLRIMLDLALRRPRTAAPAAPPWARSWVMPALLVYLCCYMLSVVANRPGAAQLIASIKSVWPMFGVLLALYWVRWTPEQLGKLWRLLVWITVLQLPIVIYQHFFVAGRRVLGFDSVVGTFGGSMVAGGLSSVMVVFVIVTLAYVLASWHHGMLSRKKLLLFGALALLVILLGEVKAAFIWLPLSIMFVLRQRMLKNVFNLIGYSMLALLLLALIYYFYNLMYWNEHMSQLNSVSDKLNEGGGYFFDVNNINYVTGEISRGASLALWLRDPVAGLREWLIGFGPGASKTGALGMGVIAKRYYPLHIDATGLAVLLWEVGVCGALAYLAMLGAGIAAAWRFLAARVGSARQKAGMETALVTLLLSLTLLVYNRTMLDEPTMQLLLLFCLGYVVQTVRFGPEAPAADVK
ncbi:hypothetical protein [Massilia sp. erpn]|uniref:hypothetical protein n=1 Tax=Massilia sp. erpn TaxID=2738142 RepID=UPI00210844F5|nr:hypothetical protein [Massilia sp. erpn]UTY55788.1 hypothetical protein HPQ68_00465 [Massilia sp. erpn]